MQLHGVFQDANKVYFAMVGHCILKGTWRVTMILGFDGMRSMGSHRKGRIWGTTTAMDSSERRFPINIPPTVFFDPPDRSWPDFFFQALGLDALHNMGIMHRDLKPENILLSRSGDVRIADLGAAYVHDASRLIRGQSYARDAVFTPGYAAPELVGSALLDDGAWIVPGSRCPRYGLEVDWWALGCIMYMMMAGCMLFPEKTDLLEYVERYKAHRGRAWLRSRCSMSENELRILYGVRAMFFFGERDGSH